MGQGLNLDCEEYLSPADCNGQMHDGEQCYWKPEGTMGDFGECESLDPESPQDMCYPVQAQGDCTAMPDCVWTDSGLTAWCGSMDDSVDCEDYLTPADCNGKLHEGD